MNIKKYKASVTIIALITVILILLLAMVIIILIMQSSQNTVREAERNRAKWYLEGRVQEYFDALQSGKAGLKTGRFSIPDNSNPDNGLTFEIGQTQSGYYSFNAVLFWKHQYKLSEYIEFDSKSIFDYAFFINGNMSSAIQNDIILSGNLGANGAFILSAGSGKKIYLHSSISFTPRFDYYQALPQWKPSYFSSDPLTFLKTNNIGTVLKESGGNLQYGKIPDKFLLPAFDTLWENFYRFRDDVWLISESSYFTHKSIINRWNSEKVLTAIGDGYTTGFDVSQNEGSVYIKKITQKLRYQNIESRQYAYCTIKDSGMDNFYTIKKGRLILKASAIPVSISLPDDAYNTLGQLALAGKDYSYISQDERLDAVYLYKPSPAHELLEGRDFKYDPSTKTVKMLAGEFYSDFTFKIGTGDGKNKTFSVNRVLDRLYFYIGGKRTESFNLYPDHVEFFTPPEYGSEVRVMRALPFFYIKKSAPAEGVGIFTDREEEAVILDLSAIQNYPESGVIMSYMPLVLKGEAAQPLVIISKENIYMENLNPENQGKPAAVISKKGVWLLKSAGWKNSGINKCIIYSPLKGLYTINESGDIADQERMIYGSLYFTFENENGAMDLNGFNNSVIYYSGINEYVKLKPFSIFPSFLDIRLVRRNF